MSYRSVLLLDLFAYDNVVRRDFELLRAQLYYCKLIFGLDLQGLIYAAKLAKSNVGLSSTITIAAAAAATAIATTAAIAIDFRIAGLLLHSDDAMLSELSDEE